MSEHPLHEKVGELLKEFAKNKDFEIKLDEACEENKVCEREQISLFLSEEKNSPNTLCKVDAIVIKEKEVKVIIEIEESGFNPTKIHGKFLTSVFAKAYINAKNEKFEIKNNSVLFVQIIDYDKMVKDLKNKGNSMKKEQFKFFAENFKEMIEKTKYGSIKSYEIFLVEEKDKEKCLDDIIRCINNFIK